MSNSFSAAPRQTKRPQPTPQQLQKLIDSSPDVICTVDAEGSFLYVSKAAEKIWGYQPEEMEGYPCSFFVHPDDVESSLQAAQKVFVGDNLTNYENRIRHKNGTMVPMVWSAYWSSVERIMYCIARSNAQHKEKEALQARYEGEMKKKNLLMSQMLMRITDGFYALDNEWRIVYANPQVEKMLNIKREDFLTRNFWDCFPTMVDSVFYHHYHTAMETGLPVEFEGFFGPFDKWFTVRAYPSATGLSIFFQDTTESKKAAEEREKFEQKLKRQSEMMREMLEQMGDGFIALDAQARVLYWNAEEEKISGISRDQVIGKILWETPPFAEEGEYYQLYQEFLKEHKPVQRSFYSGFRKKWLEVTAFATQNGVSVFTRDISEQKKAEEQVRRLSLVVQETINAVWIMDVEKRIVWINDAFTRELEYTSTEALGKTTASLLLGHEENREAAQEMIRCWNERKPYEGELVCVKKNGAPLYAHINCQPMTNGEGAVTHFFSILTNITNIKKTEGELRKLSLIAENTVNTVVLSNRDRNIFWVNNAFTQLTGYTFDEVMGKNIREVFDGPQTDPEVIAYTLECVAAKKPFRIEVLNYRKNGETYWADVSCQPMLDSNGEVESYFSIATDMTDRKKLQHELLAQQKKMNLAVIAAQEKERAQIGLELHDNVNQVLTTVKLYTELCRDGLGDKEEIMNKSISLLQNSITEIRSLSKRLSAPTLGKIKLSESVTELIEAVMATGKLSIELIANDTVDFEVDQELHLGVYRILQEHFTNILKHAGAQSVTVALTICNDELHLEIVDDGKGFDTSEKSAGIGRSNMQSRAESLKGSITLESAPGKGCRLQACFPLSV